jgi:hypothetical protein
MKRDTEDLVFFACLIAFVIFCALGLSGELPGQCDEPEELHGKLMCLHHLQEQP